MNEYFVRRVVISIASKETGATMQQFGEKGGYIRRNNYATPYKLGTRVMTRLQEFTLSMLKNIKDM